MASFKPIVISLALLSAASVSFAGQPPFPNIKTSHDSTWKQDESTLDDALFHNSYQGHVQHHYLNGDHGMWLGGFGQLVGAYNSNYLLMPGRRTMITSPTKATPASTATITVPHADVMVGYDSDHVGFFVDYGYAKNAYYDTPNTINYLSSFSVNEAYLTYKFSAQFAIKAGNFISNFGCFDPTNPMLSIVGEANKYAFGSRLGVNNANVGSVNGVEGVFTANGFYGAVEGVMQPGASQVGSKGITNDAIFNTLVLSGGYDLHFNKNTLGLNAGYANRDWFGNAAWNAGLHFDTQHWQAVAKLYHEEALLSNGKRLWMMSGHMNYLFTPRFTVGAYGDYSFNMNNAFTAILFPYHWNLGAKAGYALTKQVSLDLYIQHQTVVKSVAVYKIKNNTSGVLAVTFKL